MIIKGISSDPRYTQWLMDNPEELKIDLEVFTKFAINWLNFYIHKRKGTIKLAYQPHMKTDIDRCLVLHTMISTCNR